MKLAYNQPGNISLKYPTLSTNQLVKLTGLSRDQVIWAVEMLVKKGVLVYK